MKKLIEKYEAVIAAGIVILMILGVILSFIFHYWNNTLYWPDVLMAVATMLFFAFTTYNIKIGK